MRVLRNAIFDLDGTLIDSSGDIKDCIVGAYVACGINSPESCKIDALAIGPPLVQMLRSLTPNLIDDQYRQLAAAFRRHYDSSPLTRTVLYCGVHEILRRLSTAGVALFIATNKPHFASRRVLAKTNLTTYFTDIATPESLPGRIAAKSLMVRRLIDKWRLKPHETVVVGDAPDDILAAHENGVSSVALLSGYGNRDELRDSKATLILESIERLCDCGQFHF